MSQLNVKCEWHLEGCQISDPEGSDVAVIPLCEHHTMLFLQHVYPLFVLTPPGVLELLEVSSFVRFAALAWAYEAGEHVPEALAEFFQLADGLDFGEAEVAVRPIH